MALLMFRTFGVIIVSFIVLIMYVLHRKKNGKFIKRKAVNEEEKIKYQKWEKIINVMAVVGLLILGIFITVPCCLDIPYLLSNNLVEVTGEVTQELERMVFIIPSTMIDSSILTIVIISIWNEPREMFIGIVIMVSDLLQ